MVGSARFWERLLGGAAAVAVRRPRTTVALALASALACAALAAGGLGLKSSNLDLIDPRLPEVARFRAFAAEFGTPNLLVVVLEGDDPAALARAADRATAAIAPLPGVRTVWARLPFRDELLLPLGVDPYFRSTDGGMLFLFAQPADAESAATTIGPFVSGIRRAVAALALERERIRVGYTGLPQYALDDRDVIQRDVTRLSGYSFVAILLLFAVSFRGLREPVLAMSVLALAAVVTAGFAALVPGHLTLVSAFFFSILFGLGIDFGVHLVERARERAAAGSEPGPALVEAVRSLAPALGTGAATTALSFLLLVFSGFRGFAELGGLAGVGVVATLAGMVTVLPALLLLFPGRRGAPPVRRRSGAFLLAAARPAVALGLLALVVVATAAAVLSPPRFDGDYLKLQAKGSEAVRLEREMVRRSDGAAQFAVFVAPDAESARRLVERLGTEPTVGAVRSAADYEALLALGAEIPEEWARFRALYVDPRGRHAVYAFPEGDVWEPGFQARFTDAMRALDPEVTGMPFLGRFLVERSRRALWITGTLSAAMLLLLVAADFTNPWRAALAVAPTFGAVVAMMGGMRLLGVDFNPLNILALPIILGVAEDSGVHLVHRFLTEQGDLGRTLAGAGRTIFVCGATTLVGFGALAFADHRGLASFAIALSLGVGSALLLSLFVLPQLLRWLAPRILAHERAPAISGDGAWRRALGLVGALALLGTAAGALETAPPPDVAAPDAAPAEARAERCWRERGRGFEATGGIL